MGQQGVAAGDEVQLLAHQQRDGRFSRPVGLREPYLFIERGRRISNQRIGDAVASAAQAAGIGRVSPHQLRHTLATQAINRGMSLEAIAALLGHKSMPMTMVHAKIANRTVADEYFSGSE